MINNIRNRGLGKFLFLKTIILVLIPIIYINAKYYKPNTTSNFKTQYYHDNKFDDSNSKEKRFFIFEELGISTNQTSFGAKDHVSAKYFILDEIEKHKASDFEMVRLIQILDDSLSLEKIKEWRDYSYRRRSYAKRFNQQFLDSLDYFERRLYTKASIYFDKAKEVAQLTGLDQKVFLSLFYAESNLIHFSRSSLDDESWGIILSPQNAMGLAQVTEDGLSLIEMEYNHRKRGFEKRGEILPKYKQGKDAPTIAKELKIGVNYVLYTLQKNGVEIEESEVEPEEVNFYKFQFANLEQAAEYDSLITESFRVLDYLLGFSNIDKERYKLEPLYAFSVGSAYFYLDYIYFANHPTIELSDDELLEVCVAAYNRGRYGTERDLERTPQNWQNYKFRETRGHWKNFQHSYSILESVESKFKNFLNRNVILDNIIS